MPEADGDVSVIDASLLSANESVERPAKRQKTASPSIETAAAFTATADAPASLVSSAPVQARENASYGNYISYYNKRRPSGTPDPRLKHLLPEWIQGQKVLDVGCNSGRVTIEIAQTMNPRRVVGVDIDKRLVHKARRAVDMAWSIQTPCIPDKPDDFDRQYFPAAFPFVHGTLPTPPTDYLTTYIEQPEVETRGLTRTGVRKVMPERRYLFPRNVEFFHADWTNETIQPDERGYDTILALSVTKWIHLHGLNEGLRDFFEKCYRLILPGGRLVVEAQPFSSYAKAARRDEKLKEQWVKLRDGYTAVSSVGGEERQETGLNPDTDFDGVLLDMGFDRVETLGKTGEKGFRRTIKVYHKRKGDWL